MDLTSQIPMQCCSLQCQNLLPSPATSTTGCFFALPLSLHFFWSYFSTDLPYLIGHLPTWGVHHSVSYLFAFSYCSWVSQSNNAEGVAIPFSSVRHCTVNMLQDIGKRKRKGYLLLTSSVNSVICLVLSDSLQLCVM